MDIAIANRLGEVDIGVKSTQKGVGGAERLDNWKNNNEKYG
jgi:hypothetical protein